MLKEKPYAIMMNLPNDFFYENRIRPAQYIKWYNEQSLKDPSWCFYHFISGVPVHAVEWCYLINSRRVLCRVRVVEFVKNGIPDGIAEWAKQSGIGPRNWMIGTGPCDVPGHDIPVGWFRGFRYTQQLF